MSEVLSVRTSNSLSLAIARDAYDHIVRVSDSILARQAGEPNVAVIFTGQVTGFSKASYPQIGAYFEEDVPDRSVITIWFGNLEILLSEDDPIARNWPQGQMRLVDGRLDISNFQ